MDGSFAAVAAALVGGMRVGRQAEQRSDSRSSENDDDDDFDDDAAVEHHPRRLEVA